MIENKNWIWNTHNSPLFVSKEGNSFWFQWRSLVIPTRVMGGDAELRRGESVGPLRVSHEIGLLRLWTQRGGKISRGREKWAEMRMKSLCTGTSCGQSSVPWAVSKSAFPAKSWNQYRLSLIFYSFALVTHLSSSINPRCTMRSVCKADGTGP